MSGKPRKRRRKAPKQEPLNIQQRALLHAVLRDPDIARAARRVGVSTDLARRWSRLPAFREEHARQLEKRTDGERHVALRIAEGASLAVDVLTGIMLDATNKAGDRRGAAAELIKLAWNGEPPKAPPQATKPEVETEVDTSDPAALRDAIRKQMTS